MINRIFSKLLLLFTFLSSGLVLTIFVLLAYLCIDLFTLSDMGNFFSFDWDVEKEKFGIATMLFTTLVVSFLALSLAFVFSFSISCIVFLSKCRVVSAFLEKTILLMSAVPTIIYAFTALFTIVPFISEYKPSSTLSILVASVVLSLLLIPTMSLIFLNIFKILAKKYQTVCMNLGLSKDEFFSKYEALPFYIYYVSSEYSDQNELNSAFGAAIILLFIAISLFVITSLLHKKIRKKHA